VASQPTQVRIQVQQKKGKVLAYKNSTSEKIATFQQVGMMLRRHKNATTNESDVVTG